MATVRELPLANYPSGTTTFVRQTPNGLAGFNIAFARCTSATPTIWPDPATRLRLFIEGSYDGGATFTGGTVAWEQGGGIIVQRGVEVPASILAVRFTPEVNAVRITVEVINGPIRTAVDVTIL